MLAFAVLIAIIYAAVSGLYSSSPAASLTDRGPATDIGIKTPSGIVNLSDLKGKVVLIDFWATWCGPCRMSIPGIEKLYAERRADGLEVMGVAMEHDGGENVPSAVSQMGMTYPVGLPKDREPIKKYVKGAIPTTALVDRHGNLRWLQEGYSDLVEAQMIDLAGRLLAEK